MLGSYSPRFNYPGKIPAGLDLPSDIADKKHLEEAEKNWGNLKSIDMTWLSSHSDLYEACFEEDKLKGHLQIGLTHTILLIEMNYAAMY